MKTPLQRFWLLLRPDKKEIYQVYTYAFFKGAIALSLPIGIQSIINLIQGGVVSVSWLILVLIVVTGIAMGGYMQVMQMRITETIQQKIFARAAFDFTYRIPKIKFEEIYKHYAPELVNRFFDVLMLQKGFTKIIIEFSTAVLQIVFGLILLSLYHRFFIIFSILLVILVYVIIRITAKRGLDTSLEESKYKYQVASWLEELAKAKDSFKLAGITRLPEYKTDKHVSGYLTSRENHFQILKNQYVLLLGFKIVVALGLLLVGGILVLNQQMNIGQFVAAEIIILMVIDSTEKIILNFESIFDTLTSLEKLGQVTDLELDNQVGSSSIQHSFTGAVKVEMKDVSFTYPGRSKPLLEGVSYTFQPNQSYCIVGPNGSGKSTLLHILNGLYKAQSGSVCFNDLPIQNYSLPELYAAMGNGLAAETIFEGTLYENITMGRESVTTDDVKWAIQHTFLVEFIKTLPKGLDTLIAPSGQKLSKGIMQRIIIARSIANHPKLLLIENQLDSIEEQQRLEIIKFLTDKQNGWTLICVSHDADLQKHCDAVINLRTLSSNP